MPMLVAVIVAHNFAYLLEVAGIAAPWLVLDYCIFGRSGTCTLNKMRANIYNRLFKDQKL
jgi:hypothetical protein